MDQSLADGSYTPSTLPPGQKSSDNPFTPDLLHLDQTSSDNLFASGTDSLDQVSSEKIFDPGQASLTPVQLAASDIAGLQLKLSPPDFEEKHVDPPPALPPAPIKEGSLQYFRPFCPPSKVKVCCHEDVNPMLKAYVCTSCKILLSFLFNKLICPYNTDDIFLMICWPGFGYQFCCEAVVVSEVLLMWPKIYLIHASKKAYTEQTLLHAAKSRVSVQTNPKMDQRMVVLTKQETASQTRVTIWIGPLRRSLIGNQVTCWHTVPSVDGGLINL